jgi:hypothetical protein
MINSETERFVSVGATKLWTVASGSETPILFFNGGLCVFINASDDIRPNWPTQQLAALIPKAKYVEIVGAAHSIWLTHMEELQIELRRALAFVTPSMQIST